ncbi:unnamed protein product [Pipistrellus nathusii]|uniref:Secreted protein n=1 Tax=Pipistrellus nathusii TaxID=59473 RepID=A0ABN9Z5T3_PIPNA
MASAKNLQIMTLLKVLQSSFLRDSVGAPRPAHFRTKCSTGGNAKNRKHIVDSHHLVSFSRAFSMKISGRVLYVLGSHWGILVPSGPGESRQQCHHPCWTGWFTVPGQPPATHWKEEGGVLSPRCGNGVVKVDGKQKT